jgi:hypothetical protein
MENQIKTCKECFYFKKEMKAGANSGFCCFNPPQLIILPSTNSLGQNVLSIQSVFPVVSYSSWCGKFDNFD